MGADPIILAIDPALSAGYAVRTASGIIASGTEDFHRCNHHVGHIWQAIGGWLWGLCNQYEPTHIVSEAPGGTRGLAATRIAYGWLTKTQEIAAGRGLVWSSIHPSTLKKWATGSGKSKKPEMLAAAQARWPNVGLWSEDEVDARLLAEMAWQRLTAPQEANPDD